MTDELLAANEKLYLLNQKLMAENRKLREVLNSLANESQGFLSMANKHDHGNTNMSVLKHWIDNAREALEVKK